MLRQHIFCQFVTSILSVYLWLSPHPSLTVSPTYLPGYFCLPPFLLTSGEPYTCFRHLHPHAAPYPVPLMLSSLVVRAAKQPEVSLLREQHRGATPQPRHPVGEETTEANRNTCCMCCRIGSAHHAKAERHWASTAEASRFPWNGLWCCRDGMFQSASVLKTNGCGGRGVRRIAPDVRRRITKACLSGRFKC